MGRPRKFAEPSESEALAALASSKSLRGVMRALGIPVSSTGYRVARKVVARYPDKVGHFRWQGSNHGADHVGGYRRWHEDEILRLSDHKLPGVMVRRGLRATGRPWQCEKCGNTGVWLGDVLVLEIDHIDGNVLNNEASNLRVLCPNCHSQTPTFRRRKKPADISQLVEEQVLET